MAVTSQKHPPIAWPITTTLYVTVPLYYPDIFLRQQKALNASEGEMFMLRTRLPPSRLARGRLTNGRTDALS